MRGLTEVKLAIQSKNTPLLSRRPNRDDDVLKVFCRNTEILKRVLSAITWYNPFPFAPSLPTPSVGHSQTYLGMQTKLQEAPTETNAF